MASKLRSIARQMAHAQMAAEGIQHPNKVIPDLLKGMEKRGHKASGQPTRDSRFAYAWREYAAKRAASASLAGRRKVTHTAKKGAQRA